MSELRTLLQEQIQTITHKVHWFAGMERALEGSTAAEAAWVPSPGTNTIWQLVNHITYWTQYACNVITGTPNPEGHIDNAVTFGEPGAPTDDAGWEATKERLFAVQDTFQGLLAELDPAQPIGGQKSPIGKLIGDISLHNAHHLGQIILLRKLRGAEWQPVKWGE
jgi:hypothetical protein